MQPVKSRDNTARVKSISSLYPRLFLPYAVTLIAATLLAEGVRLDWPVLDVVLLGAVTASTLASLAAYVWLTARGR